MASLLEIGDLHAYYGDSHVLHGIDLAVARGELVAVLGRNGAGKTTLLHAIAGFAPARRGRITFASRDIAGLAPYRIARLGIALVPQGRRIFRSLTVRETLEIAYRHGRDSRWSVEAILAMFPRLKERTGARAGTLSGGEQQMLAVGRALVANPQLIMLDEPSEGLAPLLIRELERVLGTIKQQGIGIVLVEQNTSYALHFADRLYIVNRGQVACETTAEEFIADAAIRERYLGV